LEAVLTLPEVVQEMIDAGRIPVSTAAELARLDDQQQALLELAHAVAEGRLHRDQVTQAVQALVGKKKVTPKAARISCRLAGGMSFTMTAAQPMSWSTLLGALDVIRREAKNLSAAGKDVSELAEAFQQTAGV